MAAARVVFDRVWKKFRQGERHDSLRDLLPALARRLARRRDPADLQAREFWALQDLSFEVAPGEALGIIGPNGAGKSTTLKLCTRILRPNRGRVVTSGRVGALIEVAAGFHQDLTGRENIFLQGAIMGMAQADVRRKLDDIVEFAGVREFIDTPVKRYSSGMNARLGFAIAAHLEPDLLIIDEVLSVGDMAFQERCVERMIEFKRQGVAIVFVSHNLQAVSLLCDRALFIKSRVVASGATASVIEAYSAHAQRALPAQSHGDFALREARLESPLGRTDHVPPGTPLTLEASFEIGRTVRDVHFGFIVHRTTDMLTVYDGNFTPTELGLGDLQAGTVVTLRYQFVAHVVRGIYHVECHIYHNPTQTFLMRASPVGSFSVTESRTWQGVADLAVSATARQAGMSNA